MTNPWLDEEDEENQPEARLYLNAHLSRRLEKKTENRGGTVHSQFRCPEFLSRRVDEILASGHPALKTRSDVFIDALFLWLDEWDKVGTDGANGMLRAQFALYKLELERVVQNEFLEKSKQLFDVLRGSGDVKRLKLLDHHLQMVYSDAVTTAPRSYTDELESLMSNVQRLLTSAEKRVDG